MLNIFVKRVKCGRWRPCSDSELCLFLSFFTSRGCLEGLWWGKVDVFVLEEAPVMSELAPEHQRGADAQGGMWCGPPLTLLLSVCLFTWRAEEPSGGDAVAALAPPALCTAVSGGHLPPDTCSVQRRHGEHDPGAEQRAPRRYVRVRAVCGSSTLFWLKCWCYNVSALLPAPPNPIQNVKSLNKTGVFKRSVTFWIKKNDIIMRYWTLFLIRWSLKCIFATKYH